MEKMSITHVPPTCTDLDNYFGQVHGASMKISQIWITNLTIDSDKYTFLIILHILDHFGPF